MKNNYFWIIIVVVVVIGILACVLTQHVGTTETIGNTEAFNEVSNNTNNTNAVDNNTNNTIEEDTNETNTANTTTETTDNSGGTTLPEVAPNAQIYETNTDLGSTDKKQEAINIVKSMWGEDNTVTYRCDSVTSDGKYIVAVVSTQTASVKNYFKVDLNTKTAEVDY